MRAYIITHFPHSHYLVQSCVRSLEQWSWPYEITAAVTAPSADLWRAAGVEILADRGKLRWRPGAQGCWLSHFAQWQACVRDSKPRTVLEHDAVVQAAWDRSIESECQLVKLYTTAKIKTNSITGQWSAGSHAYYLTPQNAERLITHARQYGAQALDKHLGDRVLEWRFWHSDLVLLNPRRGSSTTSPQLWR